MVKEGDLVYFYFWCEVIVIVCLFVVMFGWLLVVSIGLGYEGSFGDELFDKVFGILVWVFWGILFLWIFVDVIVYWFCFYFMKDDYLDGDDSKCMLENYLV